MKEGRIRPSLGNHRCPTSRIPRASMKEGRIRPSLYIKIDLPDGRHLASMKEGRIRPSLPGETRRGRRRESSFNEGGSNSTLVGRPKCSRVYRFVASMKEGRIRPSLPLPPGNRNLEGLASMKEGRIRPSLLALSIIGGYCEWASMKEGRIRPSLLWPPSVSVSASCRFNEGGSNSTLVVSPIYYRGLLRMGFNEGGSNSTLVALAAVRVRVCLLSLQ